MSTTPDALPVHTNLFTLDDHSEHQLVGGRCKDCTRFHFPVLTTCPYCAAVDEIERVHLPSHGTLWAWTAVTAPPPGYDGEVPFGFGVVELPVGLRVITRLTESDPAKLRFGEPMKLVVVPLHTDSDGHTVVTYAFAPVAEGQAS